MKTPLRWTITVVCTVAAGLSAQAKDAPIQCANLIYAGTQTSRCFSDEFLSSAQRETAVPTERRFKSVKLRSDDLFRFPFVLITGESSFTFPRAERENLKRYLESGGFLLASAGCSSRDWDRSFRREIESIFGSNCMKPLPMDHPIFRTVHRIDEIVLSRGQAGPPPVLEGLEIDGKIVMVYSPHGLNDTAHTEGCCCCGGNEVANSLELCVNIFMYSLLY